MSNLVIVESQAKAKKIQSFLEKSFPTNSWKVFACLGHVRDLKDDEYAVDPKDWKNLKWESTSKGKKTLKEIKNSQKILQKFILLLILTEGEAIAWHILDHLNSKKLAKENKSIVFHLMKSLKQQLSKQLKIRVLISLLRHI